MYMKYYKITIKSALTSFSVITPHSRSSQFMPAEVMNYNGVTTPKHIGTILILIL